MDKSTIRQQMLRQLKNMSPADKVKKDKELTRAFLNSQTYRDCQSLGIFLSLPFEFDTSAIIDQAKADGKHVLVPKTDSKGGMTFHHYIEERVTLSSLGIREPEGGEVVDKDEIGLMVVPGLAWNQAGYRVGFGAGYYDRYLSDYKGRTCSLAYGFQTSSFLEASHDIAIQEVIYAME